MRSHGTSREEADPHLELGGELLEPLALGARAGEDEDEPLVLGERDRAHERVEPLLGREPRDRQHGDVVWPEAGLRA